MRSIASVLCVLFALSIVHAQTLNARISVTSVVPAKLRIDARLPAATNALSFRNTYGGVIGLGERIETVAAISDNAVRVKIPKLAPGEFESAEKFSHFSYEVSLDAPMRPADLSHVSSLNSDRGVLMLADLLPQTMKDVRSCNINIDTPRGWTVESNVARAGSEFSTDEPENTVFLIGPSLHEKRQRGFTDPVKI